MGSVARTSVDTEVYGMDHCSYPGSVLDSSFFPIRNHCEHWFRLRGCSLIIVLLLGSGVLPISLSPIAQGESTHVRVGIYESYPLIAPDDEDGAKGIYADITEYIAQEEDWEIEYVNGTWAECLQWVESGEIDILTDIAYTETRAEIYNFTSETVLVNWGQLYTPENSRIESFTDLEGRRVAAVSGDVHYVGEQGLRNVLEGFGVECIFVNVTSYEEAFIATENGSVDAGCVNRLFGQLSKQDFSLKPSPMIFNPIEIKYAFPKNGTLSTYLAERIDFQLTFLKRNEDSLYYRSIDQHLGQQSVEETPSETDERENSIMIVFGLVLIIMIMVGYHFYMTVTGAARDMKDKNQQLQERISRLEQHLEGLKKEGGIDDGPPVGGMNTKHEDQKLSPVSQSLEDVP
jgi:ABC-type amino acid transport substrate-binding protein